MAHYIGFYPSVELNTTIDEAYTLIQNNTTNSDVRYDVYRDKITHLVNRELMENMLLKLIESIPDDSDRKAQLVKVSHTLETTTDKLINTVLSPTENEKVFPSFEFFDKQVLVNDGEGRRRISVPLDEALAQQLSASIARVQQGDGIAEIPNLTRLFKQLLQACLQHFLVDFTKTLPLNMLKRGAIPVADSVIKTAIDMALNRLIPQMPQASLERFTEHYASMLFQAPHQTSS